MKLYSRFGTLFSVTALAAFMGACSEDPAPNSPADETLSSSSVDETLSSSSVADSNSSTSKQESLCVSEDRMAHWCGANSDQYVETGLDNGSETSGYWFTFNNNEDGGESKIEFPTTTECCYSDEDEYENMLAVCGGFCGIFELHGKNLISGNPVTGIAFNVAGEAYDEKDVPVGHSAADASAWGGVCIAYSASRDAILMLGTDTSESPNIPGDGPSVTLPKSSEGVMKCFKWDEFKSAASTKMTGEEAAKKLVSVRFFFQDLSETTGEFNVMSIGSYVEQ
ncbi:MAG: hypothetical protein MJZ25_00300 [Fibrobacter sp.]|nr:hypothetical protein [Fibrobacter sp.]